MLFSEIVENLRVSCPIDVISNTADTEITAIQFLDNKQQNHNKNTLYFSNSVQTLTELPQNCILTQDSGLSELLTPINLAIISDSDFGFAFNRAIHIIEDSLKDGYYDDMMKTLERVRDVDTLIDIASQTFGASLVLIDRDYRILSHSTQVPVTDELWQQNIEQGYCDYEFISAVKSLKSVQMADTSMMPIEVSCPSSPFKKFSCRVYCRDFLIGSLLVIENYHSFRPEHVEMLRILSGIMGYAIMKFAPSYLYMTSDYHSFLYNLIIGADPSTLPEAYLNLTFPSELQVLYCKSTSSMPLPSEGSLAEAMSLIIPGCHVISQRDNTIIIGSTDNLKKVGLILSVFPKECMTRIGISLPFTDVYTLRTHCDEAADALSIGYMLEPDNRVFTFEDYGIYRMFQTVSDNEDLSRYLHPALTKLFAYDQKNSSDLVPTLHEYLMRSCNTTDTAEALYLHRNSVIYRLHRIEELCDIDLSDTDTRFRLRLSFAITNVLNGKRRWNKL